MTATAGQEHEAPEFENLMQTCLVNTFRKAWHPDTLAGDKAYSSNAIQDHIT